MLFTCTPKVVATVLICRAARAWQTARTACMANPTGDKALWVALADAEAALAAAVAKWEAASDETREA